LQVKWEEYAKLRPRSDILRPRHVLSAVELVVVRKGHESEAEEGGSGNWEAKDEDDVTLIEVHPHATYISTIGCDGQKEETGRCAPRLLSSHADSQAVLWTPLDQVTRPPGLNDVGMVAWRLTLFTPEYPDGRPLVVIANDITVQAGSFGTREDTVFAHASQYARQRGIPRIYLAANSGARIGMADSIKSKFRVAWNKEDDPAAGFKYLYLSKADYTELQHAVRAEPMADPEGGEERYVIKDIIGTPDEKDLGVENLKGSGTIAGETSVAYNEIFTLTVVVGRTVGIGAYLVRLGQRTIQKSSHSPIILTGYQALNKLMGKAIYSSNDQLGGPMIMYPNGVSHCLVDNHLDGMVEALTWLSYVPRVRGAFLPILDITGVDVVERSIDFTPQKGIAYDPRHLVGGTVNELDGTWISGFFDRGSFTETLAGWAKTVVVGRARLGGIPIGVIITETRTAEATTPADPADSSSMERNVQQAGGVWFPDSAYKTAQAIRDLQVRFDRHVGGVAKSQERAERARWRSQAGRASLYNHLLELTCRSLCNVETNRARTCR
jgi:acetyl-CoA carboxylase/biotin carboxylase 1